MSLFTNVSLASFSAFAAIFLAQPICSGPTEQQPTTTIITMECSPQPVSAGAPLECTASMNSAEAELPIRWRVTAGKIIKGQGTPSVTLDTTGLEDQSLTAIMELGDKGCIRVFSYTAHVK
jgi:hypothetical protein